jgi:hypothetical protein
MEIGGQLMENSGGQAEPGLFRQALGFNSTKSNHRQT